MQRKTLHYTPGEVINYAFGWHASCEERGATIVSSAWEFEGGTVASPQVTGEIAHATVTPTGCGRLTNTVVLTNGETHVGWVLVEPA